MWNTIDSVEKSVIFLRSLEPTQILELAQQLTLNHIDFFLPSPKVIVLDLVGIPTASLVRLLHYSEIPVPTSMAQGAFSLSFLNYGKSLNGRGSASRYRKMQHFKVSCGRITALHSAPMQIKWEDIKQFCEPTLEQSCLPKWLKTELQGSCPKKVLAIDEERTVDWYLQFQVPQKLECTFPKQVSFGNKKLLIDHDLPFAPTRSNISRPPIEESMHDHWKNTASLARAQKKNRSNCIAHLEDCFPSLQRVNMLQEISIRSRGLRVAGSFEISSTPLLFFNGVPELADGLQAFVSVVSNTPDIATDVDHSVERYLAQPSSVADVASHSVVLYVLSVHCTDHVPLNIGRILTRRNGCIVSTTELLRCHAFTECLLLVMLPKGIRVDSFCTPKRHFEIVLRIPIRSPKERPANVQISPLTSLGENPTQSLDQGSAGCPDKSGFASRDSHLGASADSPIHDESTKLKSNSINAPQPVAVDGRGDITLSKGFAADLDSLGDDRGGSNGTPSVTEAAEAPFVESCEELPQPVAVGGCGGPLPPSVIKHDNSVLVTPTAVWTEKPVIPSSESPSQAKETMPHYAGVGDATISLPRLSDEKVSCKDNTKGINAATLASSAPHIRQNSACHESTQEQIAGSKPWVSALSTSEILAPIPEVEVSVGNSDAAQISNGMAKPKALPLKVSHAARKGLARIATPKIRPTQTQALLDGYVHGLTVETSVTLSKPLELKTVPLSGGPPDKGSFAKQSLSEGTPSVGNQGEGNEHRPGQRSLRRSKGAGQSPLTPGRRAGTIGNSKSCPPARLKTSPIKEVMKHGGKARKDQITAGEGAKVDIAEKKNKHSGPPLRRAGMDTTRKLEFFKRSTEVPLHCHGSTLVAEKSEGDILMIDVERLIAADEIRKQAAAVEQVRDAGTKWLTEYPDLQRNSIEQLAVRFLLAMNSTLCFFTVAMRMLSKAPWTEAMISLDVRQSAMVAISRGWFVKRESFCKYPFTRAELALAAGAYQGLLVPTVPDDTTVALRTIIDHLPPSCATMFTQAEVICPFCQAKRNGIAPTFSCSISWKENGWVNLKTALEQAQPFLGHLPTGWHHEGCDRDDQCPKVTKLGKWLYLELRPYPILKNDFFPSLNETVPLLSDDSLCAEGLYVDSLVCSNLSIGEGRHYWLVEVNGGRMQQTYDSLQGVQPLTQEVYRMLQVTGVLLRAAGCSKPILRNPKLDQIAGKVETVQRRQQTTRVASRSRAYKLRKQLVKSMSSLTVAPSQA